MVKPCNGVCVMNMDRIFKSLPIIDCHKLAEMKSAYLTPQKSQGPSKHLM